MHLKKFFALGLIGYTMLSASALDVENTAGTLASRITNPSSITSLKISGTIDASDLFFIGKDMTELTSLDLSDATIVAYAGEAINGLSSYAEATIPQGSFAGSKLQEVTFPTAKKLTIGEAAFTSSALQNVAFPAAETTVDAGAFAACTQLQNLYVKSPITFGTAAFKDCSALAMVEGGNLATTISESAFAGCSALTDYDFGKSLTAIGDYAFEKAGLLQANLTECSSLKSIGAWAFAHENQLVSAQIYTNVSEIGKAIFFDCPALETVVIPEACTAIPAYAFTDDTALSDVNAFHENVTEIGDYAMRNNTSITKVTVVGALEYLGDGAMEGMTNLVQIDVKSLNAVPELGKDVWAGIDQSTVTLLTGKEMETYFKSALQWQDFKVTSASQTDALDAVANDTQSVQGTFVGKMLIVRVNNVEANQLSIYNTAGLLLASAQNVTEAAQFDTSSYTDRAYVVVARLTDGRTVSLKLAR